MGMLKSLGLSPAKKVGVVTSKTFRRLFGRVLPGGGSAGAAGSSAFSSTDTSNNHGNGNHASPNSVSSRCQDDKGECKAVVDAAPKARNPDGALRPSSSSSSTTASAIAAPDIATSTENTMATTQQQRQVNKENQPPGLRDVTESLSRLSLKDDEATLPVKPEAREEPKLVSESLVEDPAVVAEREKNLRFIEEALDMARLALRTNETPVGCVLVHDDKVIARGMNATNVTRNGTRHAEFMALSALLSYPPQKGPRTTCLKPKVDVDAPTAASDAGSVDSRPHDEGNEDGSKGHLYPYGQKLHPAPRVDRSIIQESILYVTVEPCVMCASLLRQLGIKKVYFGAVNDKFGGTGGVFSIHANSLPISADGQTASAHPTPRPSQLPDGSGTLGVSFPPGGGDGGNLEPGYEIEGGWGRDEAVALLRRFYVQENGRAPVPRKKEGRAARLAAMMEKDGNLTPEEAALAAAAVIEQEDMESSTDALEDMSIEPLKEIPARVPDGNTPTKGAGGIETDSYTH